MEAGRRSTRVALALALTASCGGGSSSGEPPAPHAARERAGHHHGHGHDHGSPEALRPLMRDLHGWLGDLDRALEQEDAEAAATAARAIARACDDQDLEAPDPARFGPRFLEHDRALHGAAERLAARAAAGDLTAARASYAQVHGACVACHAQAPTASRIDLSGLAPR